MGISRSFFFLLPFCLAAITGWESTDFIWNFGLITSSDVGNPSEPRNYFAEELVFDLKKYQEIKKGDLVWVQPKFIREFCSKALPQIKIPFLLMISDGDESFPSDCLDKFELDRILADPNVVHIFAQNCDYQGPSKKVTPIPIGIDFHTVAYKGREGGWGVKGSPKQQEARLLEYLALAPPTGKRKCRAFVDFQHSDTMHGEFKRYLQFGEDRTAIFKKIIASGVVDYGMWMNRFELWGTKKEYAFSISPHGNGLDCHRTWEDLALGCIVIVKSSPLDPLYDGLPVVIVKSWEEINEENLQRWIIQYSDASINSGYREKLTRNYWLKKINYFSENCINYD